MTLKEILIEVGVKNAHIIDDAYNALPSVLPEPGIAQNFIDALDASQLERLHTLLGLDLTGGEVMVEALGDGENLIRIFEARGDFGQHAELLFGEFFQERDAKQKQLEPLLAFLRDHGVQCQTFGADYILNGSELPELVFIDLRLREHGPVQVDDAVEVYKKLKRAHKPCQPFVFLMSTLANNLSERRDEFREKAELFASQFEAMPKSQLDDNQELEAIFVQYLRVLPKLRQLYSHIDGLVEGLQSAALNVKKSVQALDLADYFVLHRNTISIEKVGLGVYISDLLLDYVTHEIEGMQSVWDFAKDLDEWQIEDLPRSRFALSPAASKIYEGNVLHSRVRLQRELERGLGPADGYFYLGDIFFSAKEYNEAKPKTALVIATPACDLVRPEELRKRTIFLCEGRVKAVTAASVPAGDDGVATVVMPHPHDASKRLLINWNKKRLHTWHADHMEKFAEPDECHWVRVARLRPLYAIQLQHAITADLSRIGVQRAPNVLVPHGVEVLVRGDKQWQVLDNEDRNEASAAALSDSGERTKQTVFILSDTVVRRIARKLRAWLGKNSTVTATNALTEVLDHPEFDQRLMYLTHQVPDESPEEESGDITGYPMKTATGLHETSGQAVAFVRPATPSLYVSVCGGQAPKEEQAAVLVFKFIRIAA